MPTRGILLANLGSPAGCDTASVRRYLDEFLMDPYVMDVPWPIRRLIVSGFILPTRPKRSAQAYRAIWRDSEPGSPLIHFTEALARRVRGLTMHPVAVGMRYGSPSLAAGLAALGAVDEVFLVPMYPQHADATRTTTIEHVRSLTDRPVRVMPPFFADPAFLDATAARVRESMEPGDHVLFSYHGLPERHLTRADPTGSHCLQSADCCEKPSAAHGTCYRHQCRETTRALVTRLGIERYSISFQSRLGRLPWLRPYTDEVLAELPAQGVRHLTVAGPAFTADNLETLEEIGMRGRETFLGAGGKAFRLAPCVNDDVAWARAVAGWCDRQSPTRAIVGDGLVPSRPESPTRA